MVSKIRRREQAKLVHTIRLPESVTDSSIFDFFASLDCPRSLTAWLLYSSGEHKQLSQLSIDPCDYNDPSQFRNAYTATCFLSKCDFLKLDVSKDTAAKEKFFKFEEQCKQTNSRFRNLNLDPQFKGSNVWLLNATIRKISQILGEFDAEEFIDESNWGPGVSTILKGAHVSAANKFHAERGITRDLYDLVCDWFSIAYPLWGNSLTAGRQENGFLLEAGNVIVTVPKNSSIDRVIAIEPGINLWFQKGLGRMIRKRLARRGVDLNSQEKNQQMARLYQRYATVDFSSASDSIALNLVRELLPPTWFSVLNACRSSVGRDKDSAFRWEKFSSMGNGFTFELESLIFYAAALSVQELENSNSQVRSLEKDISVYGDDVIIPLHLFSGFSRFSEFLGFTVNPKKSYSDSYFRESCGAHWFKGEDCKPIYLKGKLLNVQSIYKLANNVRDLSHRRCSNIGCDDSFLHCWRHLYRRVPSHLRFGIPLGYGDGGFIKNFDEAAPSVARNGIEGFNTSCVIESGVTQHFEEIGLELAHLRLIANRRLTSPPTLVTFDRVPSYNTYTLRGKTKSRIGCLLVPQWYNLGPWMSL